MQIVPVIDLKGGQVVHARGGARDSYTPIETPLARSSTPAAVVDGLLSLHPFEALYVADLDAIEGRGDHRDTLDDLQTRFPNLALWIDQGVSRASDCRSMLTHPGRELILGSESQSDEALLKELCEEFGDGRVILSLDYRGDDFLGPASLLETSEVWPSRIIVMTLARVGGGEGPDSERLIDLRERAPDRAYFAAGGVRGLDDLLHLREIGAAGALIASCLHDGRLTAEHVKRFAG